MLFKIYCFGQPYYQMTCKDKAEIYSCTIYYCIIHNTTINSTLIDNKIPKCNSCIYYEKNTEAFYLESGHSLFYENWKKQNYENLAYINAEASNYLEFLKDLIKYLEFNLDIKYTEFKIKANKLYYKNKCNFEIKENTFKSCDHYTCLIIDFNEYILQLKKGYNYYYDVYTDDYLIKKLMIIKVYYMK